MTLLQALIEQLLHASKTFSSPESRPRALLWTDEAREWFDVVPLLRHHIPDLLTLGSYSPDARQGPMVYLLTLMNKISGGVPILYLPGISRTKLRIVEDLDWNLQPLGALQHQSLFWTQENAKDWTRLTFVTAEKGMVRWSVASDEPSKEALRRTFLEWLERDIADGHGRILNEGDFHSSVIDDTGAMMLRWIESSDDLGEAFAAEVKKSYQIDVKKQTKLDAVNKLQKGENKAWDALWSRFCQAPGIYPGIVELLAGQEPDSTNLFVDESRYLSINQKQEATLGQTMAAAGGLPLDSLRAAVAHWEKLHGHRRSWVWKKLGRSPMAEAIGPLAELVHMTSANIAGSDFESLAASYTAVAWKADLAFLQVLAHPIPLEYRQTYRTLADRLYRPWLEDLALRFQKLDFGNYPRRRLTNVPEFPEGTCVLFVDGLRWDLGQLLTQRLEKTGARAEVHTVWSALPTVTATAKPAVSPLEPFFTPPESPKDFQIVETYHFRKQLAERGWTYINNDKVELSGRGWTEIGDIDTKGHNGELPSQYSLIVDEIVWRIQGLLSAGWKTVKVVTDHGWLLLPEGLPKTGLSGVLTPNRGERAAWLHPGNPGTELQAPWFWNPVLSFQTGPGISAFYPSIEYAHGGLSLQECLVPEITVSGSGEQPATTDRLNLIELKWSGMWLKMTWSEQPDGYLMDLRMAAGDAASSILDTGLALSSKLVVGDDSYEGKQVWLVVQSASGQVVYQQQTTVGG